MKTLLVLLACAASLLAQPPAPPAPTFDNASAYLGLTAAQLTSLEAIETAKRAALDPLMRQLRTAQRAGDTQTVTDLQAKIAAQRTVFENQAVAILTAAQQTKLTALAAAAKLGPTIREATMLNLLTPPARPDGSPDGTPRGPGSNGGREPHDRHAPPPPVE